MYLIAGLGNPGLRYRKTRHNLGFMVLDRIAQKERVKFKKKGQCQSCEVFFDSKRVVLAKPTTYMNRSGIAIESVIKKYNLKIPRIIILCDDLNLPLGKIRIRKKGSHGGHKGLASIIDYIGTSDFPRLRMGIGNDPEIDSIKFVLSPFKRSELQAVESMIEAATLAVREFVVKGIDSAMNLYNSLNPCSHEIS